MTDHWTKKPDPTPVGNWGRFVDADPIVTPGGGNFADEVDFGTTFTTRNPWVFTDFGPVEIVTPARNDP
jgi:hypothetical protein